MYIRISYILHICVKCVYGIYLSVNLLEDCGLGKKGDEVKVRRGFYRQLLYPQGIAGKEDVGTVAALKQEMKRKSQEEAAAMSKAIEQKEKIEAHGTRGPSRRAFSINHFLHRVYLDDELYVF